MADINFVAGQEIIYVKKRSMNFNEGVDMHVLTVKSVGTNKDGEPTVTLLEVPKPFCAITGMCENRELGKIMKSTPRWKKLAGMHGIRQLVSSNNL